MGEFLSLVIRFRNKSNKHYKKTLIEKHGLIFTMFAQSTSMNPE